MSKQMSNETSRRVAEAMAATFIIAERAKDKKPDSLTKFIFGDDSMVVRHVTVEEIASVIATALAAPGVDEGATTSEALKFIESYVREGCHHSCTENSCSHKGKQRMAQAKRILTLATKQAVRANPAPAWERPKIVVICGSSRFVDRIAVLKWQLEKVGDIAIGMHLLPHWYGAKEHHQAEHENVAAILDELHLRKIDMADEVLIANYDGYIGERTRIEIEYATKQRKPIRYLEPVYGPLQPPAFDESEVE